MEASPGRWQLNTQKRLGLGRLQDLELQRLRLHHDPTVSKFWALLICRDGVFGFASWVTRAHRTCGARIPKRPCHPCPIRAEERDI